MSRGKNGLIWRSLAVWALVTAAAAAGAAMAPAAWQLARPGAGPAQFADLLVATCALGLVLALAWLWLVTTVTVVELATGRLRAGGGATRRLVLVACGAAVLAGTTAPALAAGDGTSVLSGLQLPDRSVSTGEVHRTRAQRTPSQQAPSQVAARPAPAPQDHVVRPGDSLWSIAKAAPRADGDVNARWREIWAANREVIGDDPDLILPGQHLRLPHNPTHTDEGAR